jgi:hypothetical protein
MWGVTCLYYLRGTISVEADSGIVYGGDCPLRCVAVAVCYFSCRGWVTFGWCFLSHGPFHVGTSGDLVRFLNFLRRPGLNMGCRANDDDDVYIVCSNKLYYLPLGTDFGLLFLYYLSGEPSNLDNKHCCVGLKTCIFIIVFQFYNTTGCPVKKYCRCTELMSASKNVC